MIQAGRILSRFAHWLDAWNEGLKAEVSLQLLRAMVRGYGGICLEQVEEEASLESSPIQCSDAEGVVS